MALFIFQQHACLNIGTQKFKKFSFWNHEKVKKVLALDRNTLTKVRVLHCTLHTVIRDSVV